jgi:hypothetical protein
LAVTVQVPAETIRILFETIVQTDVVVLARVTVKPLDEEAVIA